MTEGYRPFCERKCLVFFFIFNLFQRVPAMLSIINELFQGSCGCYFAQNINISVENYFLFVTCNFHRISPLISVTNIKDLDHPLVKGGHHHAARRARYAYDSSGFFKNTNHSPDYILFWPYNRLSLLKVYTWSVV